MAAVQTVLGPIDASDLGRTLSHEHVLISPGCDWQRYPWHFDRRATLERAVAELREARSGGVDALIDLTAPDLGRDVKFIAEASRQSGVHIVAATGLWCDVPRSFGRRKPDEIAEIFAREIEVGIDDTDIRAGVIKVASDAGGVTPAAELVLRGAARAHRLTGCPISTHQWAPDEIGRRQVEVLQTEGVPLDRVCIGHSADTTDVGYLEALLQAGVYLSMDRYPGRDGHPNWEQRNATLMALIERGWASRLMLGHDYAPLPLRAGQEPPTRETPTRYLFLTRVALPALRASGVDEATLEGMLRDVPRRFLAGPETDAQKAL